MTTAPHGDQGDLAALPGEAALEAPPQDEPESRLFELRRVGLSHAAIRAVAALALLATVFGRALSPALPGSTAGIGAWIALTDRVTSHLAQAFAFAGTAVAVWLCIATLRHRRFAITYRLTVVPLAASVIALVMMSASNRLTPNVTLLLAVGAATLGGAGMLPALAALETRATGLVLGMISVSGLADVAARVLALHASTEALPSLFFAGRAVTTGALVLDALAIGVVVAWMVLRWPRLWVPATSVAVTVAATLSWGAAAGSRYGAPLWQVLASRSVTGLVRDPAPLLVPQVHHFVELLAILASGLALITKGRGTAVPSFFALVLVARTGLDIPLGALAMTVAALLAPLSAVGGSSRRTPPVPRRAVPRTAAGTRSRRAGMPALPERGTPFRTGKKPGRVPAEGWTMADRPRSVLVVEDDRPVARAIARVLTRRGHSVTAAHDRQDATGTVGAYDCGVFDIDLPDGSGLDLAKVFLKSGRVTVAVFFSASDDPDVQLRASDLGTFVSKKSGIHALAKALSESVDEALEEALAVGAEGHVPLPRRPQSEVRRKRRR